ncbi:MAG: CotS family spore coat protein [Pseudomonadota bacterium]
MQKSTELSCASDISPKEIEMLEEIIRHYDFCTVSVEKIRSAYKLRTDKGDFCLKRVSHGYVKARKSYALSCYLRENGFDNTAEYYKSKNGKAIIKNKDAAYYITLWIEGREASFSRMADILRCARLLAEFHHKAKAFKAPKHVKMKEHTKKWGKSFKRCKEDLEGFMEHIDKLKLKSDFDYKYRDSVDIFRSEAEFSLEILKHSRYEEMCRYYREEGYVCHDSFYYQNIIIDKSEKLYIVDLESSQYDIPVSDLGKLLRRVLSKKRYLWDFDLCRRIIEEYGKEHPLAREEYELLLSILVFPHKFWKLGKKKYIRNKKWNEAKYVKKLRRLLRERKYKQEFILCYITFYCLDIIYEPYMIEI